MGAVELSGRVLEGERGFRAEHARIVGPLEIALRQCGVPSCRQPAAAVDMAELFSLCSGHESLARDPWSGPKPVAEFAPMLQARLELRYGVDVVIDKGAQPWT